MKNPFRYFNSSSEVIRLTVMMYVQYPLSLRHIGDLLFERGIDIYRKAVRFWWNMFRPMFATETSGCRLDADAHDGGFNSGQNQGAKNVGFWVPGHRFAEVR
jgi:hypothetical protein